MALYRCPVPTCNVSFDGSVDDIAPQAIMHAQGSHQIFLSYEDVVVAIGGRQTPVTDSIPAAKNPIPTPKTQPVQPSSQSDNPDWWKV